jgi:hypothetical protein
MTTAVIDRGYRRNADVPLPEAVLLSGGGVGAWWYMAAPSVRAPSSLVLVTAAAFLYRHDHGVYIGSAQCSPLSLRASSIPHRELAVVGREVVAFAAAVGAPLMPGRFWSRATKD